MPEPLSRTQKYMWFGEQLARNAISHLIPIHLLLTGPLDAAALSRALGAIVERHPVLRTSIDLVNGEPVGVTRPSSAFELEVVTLGVAALEASGGLEGLRAREAAEPLDLADAIPLRSRLYQLPHGVALLCLTVHHVAFDDWSRYLLFDELAEFYAAFREGRPAALSPTPQLYVEFARRTERELADDGERLLAFWRPRLASVVPFELPPQQPRPTERAGFGAAATFRVPPEVTAGLAAIGREAGASPAMVRLAAAQALLRRYTGRDDVTVGTIWAQRDEPECEQVVGPLVNPLVLCGDTAGNPRFTELLGRAADTCLDAFEHSRAPFGWLAERLGVTRDASRTPLFQVLVGAGSATRRVPVLAGVEVRELPAPVTTSKYDLSIWFEQHPDGSTEGEIVWDSALYTREAMERLAGHLRCVLTAVAARPDLRISDLPLLSGEETAALTRTMAAGPRTQVAQDLLLHGPFEARALATPEAVALVDPQGAVLQYGALDERANRLAERLRQRGIGPEARVAICAERSAELVVALLAVLKAGGAFVPLDPHYPADRLAYMLADSAPAVVLTQRRFRALVATAAAGSVVELDDAAAWSDSIPDSADQARPPAATARAGADNAAYVIYTSGSTGRPKGVINTHRGIVNRIDWLRRTYPIGPGDAVLQKTPAGFDVSVWEFFWPLWTGARLVLARPDGHKDPEYMRDLIAERGITAAHFVPSMLAGFLALTGIERCESLRTVFCSGEELPKASVTQFNARLPRCGIHDLYGPTEAAIDVTAFACEPRTVAALPAIPIGTPVDNVRTYVLDDWYNPVPVGVTGELYIGGVAVARGYHGLPGLTAQRFLPDPFGSPGDRMYRSGDLARWRVLPDGRAVLDFLGRADGQIKLNGVRIEPGEIEHVLRERPGVDEAVVVAREFAAGDTRLVAYCSGSADGARLRQALAQRLPSALVPAAVVMLPALPLAPSGKVDRAALPAPDLEAGAQAAQGGYVAPRNAVEQAIAEVWSEVLGVGRVGARDDFFRLGGNSLLLIRAANRVRELFDLDVPLSLLFAHPTPTGTAAGVERIAAAAAAAV